MSLSDLRLFDETLIITFVQRGSDVFSVGPTHVQALSLTPSLCDLTLLTAVTAVCLVVGESAQSAKARRFGESLNAAHGSQRRPVTWRGTRGFQRTTGLFSSSVFPITSAEIGQTLKF